MTSITILNRGPDCVTDPLLEIAENLPFRAFSLSSTRRRHSAAADLPAKELTFERGLFQLSNILEEDFFQSHFLKEFWFWEQRVHFASHLGSPDIGTGSDFFVEKLKTWFDNFAFSDIWLVLQELRKLG